MNIHLSGDFFMLNYIWSGMIVFSFVLSFVNGTVSEVCSALYDGAEEGLKLTLSIAGIMAFWSGIMNMAKENGISKAIENILSPFIRLLFPEAKKDTAICGDIAMNMTANLLGMGNAATPLGINAMKRLSRYSRGESVSDSMCLLAVMNSASIQLIPSTLIAIRTAMGSGNPAEIIIPIWIVSAVTFAFGIILCRFLGRKI